MFYKSLIYFVTVLLIGAAGYYFHKTGIPELIVKTFPEDKKTTGVSALEVFSGTYKCTGESGCHNPIQIVLEEDTTMDIVATVDGEDISLGQGTWGIGKNGTMVLLIERKPDMATSSYPSSLIINKISSLRLANFSTRKGLLPGMDTNPVFNRVQAVNDQDLGQEP